MKPQTPRGSSQKMANSLVALSSAAVLTVYAAGYLRTRPAAERFAVEAARRETKSPAAATTPSPATAPRQSPLAPPPTNLASAPPRGTVSPPASTSTAIPNAPTAALPESSPTLPSVAPPAVQTSEPTAPEADITTKPAPTPAAAQQEQVQGRNVPRLGFVPPRRYPGVCCGRGWPDCFGFDRPMPDALFVFLDRGPTIAGYQSAEHQRRLRVGRHTEHRRIRRRCRGRPVQGEMTDRSNEVCVNTRALMGTLVTIQVVGHGSNRQQTIEREEGVERAFGWFRRVEESCTRFDPQSEVMQLTARTGDTVAVSEMLYEAVRFALAVAEESGGAFDPTVGHQMESARLQPRVSHWARRPDRVLSQAAPSAIETFTWIPIGRRSRCVAR